MLLYDPAPNEWWWAHIGVPMLGVAATVVLGVASFFVALAAWRVSAAATRTSREAHEATIERQAQEALVFGYPPRSQSPPEEPP